MHRPHCSTCHFKHRTQKLEHARRWLKNRYELCDAESRDDRDHVTASFLTRDFAKNGPDCCCSLNLAILGKLVFSTFPSCVRTSVKGSAAYRGMRLIDPTVRIQRLPPIEELLPPYLFSDADPRFVVLQPNLFPVRTPPARPPPPTLPPPPPARHSLRKPRPRKPRAARKRAEIPPAPTDPPKGDSSTENSPMLVPIPESVQSYQQKDDPAREDQLLFDEQWEEVLKWPNPEDDEEDAGDGFWMSEHLNIGLV